TVSQLPADFHVGSPERVPLPMSFRFYCIGFPFPASTVLRSMDKTGCAMWTADVTCPSQTLHHIVVTTRVQCRMEVKSLRKELIAEGFLGFVPLSVRRIAAARILCRAAILRRCPGAAHARL